MSELRNNGENEELDNGDVSEEKALERKKRPLLRLILAAIVVLGGYSLFSKRPRS